MLLIKEIVQLERVMKFLLKAVEYAEKAKSILFELSEKYSSNLHV